MKKVVYYGSGGNAAGGITGVISTVIPEGHSLIIELENRAGKPIGIGIKVQILQF